MKTLSFQMVGQSPISFSKHIQSVKNTGEAHDAFEARTWRERCHTDADGMVIFPGMALKNMLGDTAKFLGEKVPGKGQSTYTKHFDAGIMVVRNLEFGVHVDDVDGETLFVPSDGKKGGGSRVEKTFPVLAKWEVDAEIIVLDPTLETKVEEVVVRYLHHAGKFIGIGRWRPRNGGMNGRFLVRDVVVTDGASI
jgi:hypothetical protein